MNAVAFQGWYQFTYASPTSGPAVISNRDIELTAGGVPLTGTLRDAEGGLLFEGDRSFPGGAGEALFFETNGTFSDAGAFYGTLVPPSAPDITILLVESGNLSTVTSFNAFFISDRVLTQAEMEAARPTNAEEFFFAAVGGDANFAVPCFLTGTRILTALGEVAVEALRVGDAVKTMDGRTVPVRWIGQRSVSTAFARLTQDGLVRISAGALGEDIPRRDLFVTADHAVWMDGLLINAGALMNDATVTRAIPEQTGRSYTVWHVETEKHEVLLAEGMPVESFVDYAGRDRFDNAATAQDHVIAEAPYPRISSARQLPPALRQKTVA